MNGILLFAAGMTLIVVIAYRLRSDTTAAPPPSMQAAPPHRFTAPDGGVFDAQVVALEFDEAGPVIFVNGKFNNGEDRVDIDGVTAEVETGVETETFVSFDPDIGDSSSSSRIGNLVNLTAPLFLEPKERGMFRAPLFCPEREERLSKIMDRLDIAAARMVEKLDREFESYSVEGESLKRLEEDFKRDFVVKEIAEQIEKELTWKEGRLAITVSFVSSDYSVVEKIPITLYIENSDARKLRGNVDIILANSLRAELDIDLEHYSSVIYEKS